MCPPRPRENECGGVAADYDSALFQSRMGNRARRFGGRDGLPARCLRNGAHVHNRTGFGAASEFRGLPVPDNSGKHRRVSSRSANSSTHSAPESIEDALPIGRTRRRANIAHNFAPQGSLHGGPARSAMRREGSPPFRLLPGKIHTAQRPRRRPAGITVPRDRASSQEPRNTRHKGRSANRDPAARASRRGQKYRRRFTVIAARGGGMRLRCGPKPSRSTDPASPPALAAYAPPWLYSRRRRCYQPVRLKAS